MPIELVPGKKSLMRQYLAFMAHKIFTLIDGILHENTVSSIIIIFPFTVTFCWEEHMYRLGNGQGSPLIPVLVKSEQVIYDFEKDVCTVCNNKNVLFL